MRPETTLAFHLNPVDPLPKRKRIFFKIFISFFVFLMICGGSLFFGYRPFLRYFIRAYAIPRLETQLKLKIQVGSIEVENHSLVFKQVYIKEEIATLVPPLLLSELKVDWDLSQLWKGQIPIHDIFLQGAHIELQTSSFSSTKELLSTFLKRFQSQSITSTQQIKSSFWQRWLKGPNKIHLSQFYISIKHNRGIFEVKAMEALFQKGQSLEVTLHQIKLPLPTGIIATCEKATLQFLLKNNSLIPTDFPHILLENGEVAPWKRLSLTGIRGTIQLDITKPKQALISLTGGYGGVEKELWEAKGWLQLDPKEADIELRAKRFKLSALQPLLKPAADSKEESSSEFTLHGTTVLNSEHTDMGAQLQIRFTKGTLSFDGSLQVNNLSFFNPRLVTTPIRKVNMETQIHGRLEHGSKLILENSSFRSQGAQLNVNLIAEAQPSDLILPTGEPFIPKNLRERFRLVDVHLQIPPIPCQTLLNAIPKPLIPKLDGLKLKGTYSTDIWIQANFTQLLHLPESQVFTDKNTKNEVDISLEKKVDKTKNSLTKTDPVLLFGKMPGLDHCQVIKMPTMVDSKRLQNNFSFDVESAPGKWKPMYIGPQNPLFTPYEQISPHLIHSIMTTEDHGFMYHHGFIISEFRTALQENLRHGAFRFGASSITMQMIKNVLLSKEKTLGRKLQELILTWHLDYKRNLSKKRILEIYFNAIEFGPGIYGIGRATKHYFGKNPKDLTPREAAWFSSILPSPKSRHAFYCYGAPSEKWENYLNRILKKNHERGRLTDEEYEQALQEKLVFDRTEFTSQSQCLSLSKQFRHAPEPQRPMDEELEEEQ